MRTVASSTVLLLCCLSTGASSASAQSVAHAPDGGSIERLQSIAVTPKSGVPFRATVVTSWTRVLEDGTHITVKNHRTVARDSTGRIFQERRSFSPNGDTQETRLSALEYVDPRMHELYKCDPMYRTCLVSHFDPPPENNATEAASVTLPNGAGTIKRESLGEQWMQGISVMGSREITTINPGPNGYKQPEPTIKEFWYSAYLDLNLVVKRFEPRGGAEDFTVTNLTVGEPNPELFTPPADYKIVRSSER